VIYKFVIRAVRATVNLIRQKTTDAGSDPFSVSLRSAEKSNATSWSNQNLWTNFSFKTSKNKKDDLQWVFLSD